MNDESIEFELLRWTVVMGIGDVQLEMFDSDDAPPRLSQAFSRADAPPIRLLISESGRDFGASDSDAVVLKSSAS